MDLFQSVLETLRQVAERYGTSIANVAPGHVLDLALVRCVIVGASRAGHADDSIRLGARKLSARDYQDTTAILAQRSGPNGEVCGLERDCSGLHGAIMKSNVGKTPISNCLTES